MSHIRIVVLHAALVLVPVLVLTGCEDKKSPSTAAPTGAAPKSDDHAHKPGDSHASDSHAGHGHGHGDGAIDLGKLVVGAFTVQASRDKTDMVAGEHATIDAIVTPSDSAGVKAVAVRLWIGTEDAKGSIKAKAEVEGAAASNHWHTHAEIPSPLAPTSKLWIEIEDSKGGKHVGGFELKK